MLLLFALIVLLTFALYKLNENYNLLALCKRFKTIDGKKLEDTICVIPGTTIFGNNLDFVKLTPEEIFAYNRRNTALAKRKSYILYVLRNPIYNIVNAEDAEALFQSTALLKKSTLYNTINPFLGEGLLISSDHKWHSRRKILTPAFHFNVLQSFNEVFKEESIKLLNRLEKLTNENINLADIITEFTLNNVCETALGVKLDDIHGSSTYRKKIHDIELLVVERVHNPIMIDDTIFKYFGKYDQHMRDVKVVHDFCSRIIEKKRQEFQEKRHLMVDQETDVLGMKKRYAMLDTLLNEESKGNIDHQGICDEVNTFVFEGYDTTSTGLIFAFLNLALHPDVQDKCRKEIENLGDILSLSVSDFNNLGYLECVIKETLRLYPSVPFIGRTCVTETHLNGLIMAPGSEIFVQIFEIMRDPKHFPDPLSFKPERFFPENSVNRHPYAYVPFSAGSRNCIGQKFAILEMKAMLVAVLKRFEILPVTQLADITFEVGLVLRTKQKVIVKLKKI